MCQSAWLLHIVSSCGQGPSLTIPFILSLIYVMALCGSGNLGSDLDSPSTPPASRDIPSGTGGGL